MQSDGRILDMFINRPSFLFRLKRRGLSADEIKLCCLIIMGFPIKYLAVEFHNPSIYRLTGQIRKKLMIDKDRTLKESLSVIYESRDIPDMAVDMGL